MTGVILAVFFGLVVVCILGTVFILKKGGDLW